MSNFNVDWTSPHADKWKAFLAPFAGQPNVRGLEIGVLEGRSTLWFCDEILTGPLSHIHCVDPFLQTHTSGFQMRREGYSEAKETFLANTERCKDKIELFHGPSIKFFGVVGRATEKYDFCYIDGSHTLCDAATDLFWCFAMTKPGGVIIVDDYEYTDVIELEGGDFIYPGVTEAVNGFLLAAAGKVEVMHKGKQAILRKLRS